MATAMAMVTLRNVEVKSTRTAATGISTKPKAKALIGTTNAVGIITRADKNHPWDVCNLNPNSNKYVGDKKAKERKDFIKEKHGTPTQQKQGQQPQQQPQQQNYYHQNNHRYHPKAVAPPALPVGYYYYYYYVQQPLRPPPAKSLSTVAAVSLPPHLPPSGSGSYYANQSYNPRHS